MIGRRIKFREETDNKKKKKKRKRKGKWIM